MLHTKSLSLAETIATELTNREAVATPVQGSLLEALSTKCVSPLLDPYSTAVSDKDEFLASISATANSPSPLEEGGTSHDRLFIDACERIGGMVSKHMSFIQGTVVPIVQTFYESVSTRIKNSATSSPVDNLSVVALRIPALLDELASTSDVLDVSGLNLKPPEYVPMYTNLTITPAMFTTGDADHDELLKEWMDDKSPEFFNNACNLLAATPAAPLAATRPGVILNEGVSFLSLTASVPYKKLDYGIALYFITKYLLEKPELVNVNKKGGNWFSSNLGSVNDFARNLMKSAQIALERVYKTKELVVRTQESNLGTEIQVDDRLYQEWLSKGGSVEAILGVLVSGKVSELRYVSMIDEKIPELVKAYERYRRVADLNWRANSFTRFKEVLSFTFNDLMQGLNESEKTYIQANPSYVPTANARFEGYLSSLKNSDMDELDMVCMKLVCRTRFSYTDAESVLTFMDELSKADSSLSADEAASLAALKQISKYVLSQMKLIPK